MALETLEILIEADKSGLESQLKRAGQSITQFVSSMNRQEISWTQILSKNVTPALMATIASTFAIAITQALKFQTAVQQASLSSAGNLTTGSNAMSDALLGISSATGQSASEVAEAYGSIAQVFKDAGVALAVLNDEAKIATIRGMDLTEVSRVLNPALQTWGIDTVQGVDKALAILNSETRIGKIGFSELAEAVAEAGVSLRGKIDLSNAVAQLERLSTVVGETAPIVVGQFKVIADGMANPLSPLVLLNGGMDHLTSLLKEGGLPALMQSIANHLKEMGPAAYEVGHQMGFTNEQIKVFMDSAPGAFAAVKPLADADVAAVKDLNDQLEKNLTFSKQLKIAWTEFLNDLLKGLNTWDSLIGKISTGFGDFFKSLFTGNAMGAINVLGGDFKNETTPATLGLKSFSDNAQNSKTGLNLSPSSNPGLSPINNYNNFNMVINAPSGGEKQTGESILSNIKDMSRL